MSMSRLRVGDVLKLEGDKDYIVWLVNDCRACCIPMDVEQVSYVTKLTDKKVEFKTSGRSIGISPNSEVPIVRRLGINGLKLWLDENKASASIRSAVTKRGEQTEQKEMEDTMISNTETVAGKAASKKGGVKATKQNGNRKTTPKVAKETRAKAPAKAPVKDDKSEDGPKDAKRAFVEGLILKGTLTREQIVAKAVKEFPDWNEAKVNKRIDRRLEAFKRNKVKVALKDA